MKKMKKWELLKKAYETYPAGTIARFRSAANVEHVSDGTFKITEDRDNGICVVNEGDISCFYASIDSTTGEEIEEWAIPDAQPKKQFIMMSEDGVELNRDDNYCMVKNIPATGNVWKVCIESVPMNEISFAITDPNHCKAFSTKEAAVKWCEEKNRKQFIVIGENSQYPIIVTATEATIKCMGDIHKDNIILWPGEINEIADALEQLNAK